MAASEAAFRATVYRVEAGTDVFDLRIDTPDFRFDDFLRRHGVCDWGIITAHNPGGVRYGGKNALRQRSLLQRLIALGYAYYPACNRADDGEWPEEPGFLVLQASEDEMRQLASEFSQLAFVCGRVGSAPRLVWTYRPE